MRDGKIEIIDSMIFLTGLCSTLQLVNVFSVTLFSLLMLIFVILQIVAVRKISIQRKAKYVFAYLLVATISELMSLTIPLDNRVEWISTSITSYILLIVMILFCIYLMHCGLEKIQIYLRGVYYSCIIELIWCYLQWFFINIANVNINGIIWNSDYINSRGYSCLAGLNVHPALLAPALVFLFLTTSKYSIKILSLLIFFISGNSTLMISGVVLSVCMLTLGLFEYAKRDGYNKLFKKLIVVGILLIPIIGVAFVKFGILDRIIDMFHLVAGRLSDAYNGSFSDGSTFTHTRYYTSILEVWKRIGLYNIFWGFGLGCAGVPFVSVFGQYKDLIYIPESDFITFLYNFGLLGVIVTYVIFGLIIVKGRKIDYKYVVFMITILISGIFYNMQMNWVLLIEWLFLYCIKYNISAFHMNKCDC